MESITNAAKIAANAVWPTEGQKQNEEPISGEQGNTGAGEPFDAGNKENTTSESANTAGTAGTTGTTATTGTSGSTTTPGNSNPSGSLGTSSTHHSDDAATTDTSAGAAAAAPSSTTTGDSSHQQADAGHKETALDSKTAAERENVDDSGKGVDRSENPAKVDGPGPQPVDEVAKQHGGDAGAAEGAETKEGSAGSTAKGGQPESGPGAPSKGEGTGEKYIKSTGLAADGGDFDATKAGAGKEADRLLEEQGVENPAAAAAAGHKTTDKEESPSGTPKEKTKFIDKVKAKLGKKESKA